ncbi:MAG: DUF4493 domain-containing protein [Bacteroidales bacterium]|nr:DUF4493 domain-containing protein [Bacteroidales bacterium]
MKKIVLWILLLTLALSCSKQASAPGTGTLRLSLSSVDLVDEAVKGTLADYGITAPAAADFFLSIKNASGQLYWSGKVSEWTGEIALIEGKYTVSAVYGTEGEEGFEKPWFGASEEVNIVADQAHDVVLNARLANTMVKVSHTAMFDNYFKDCSLTFLTGNGASIVYPETETRPVFIEAFRFGIRGTVTARESGKVYAIEADYNDGIASAACYTLQLGVETVGGMTVNILFNDHVDKITLEEDLYE